MDFLFRQPSPEESRNLAQGDIIRKSEVVADVLRQAHAYYAEKEEYFALIVLTQSCDLTRRGGGNFKAPYITVAAMKRANVAIRELEPSVFSKRDGIPVSVAAKSKLRKVESVIERLIHNTLDDYFYIPRSTLCAVPEACVAYLRLSVALRKSHYDALLENRVGQLNDVFRAKLGWLTGNIYSRVATPDVEETVPNGENLKKSIIEGHLPDDLIVLDGFQAEEFRKKIKQHNGEVTNELVAGFLDNIPQEIEIVAQRIADRLVARELIPDTVEEKRKLIRSLVNEPVLKQLVNRG